jgi:hypothetical protein
MALRTGLAGLRVPRVPRAASLGASGQHLGVHPRALR